MSSKPTLNRFSANCGLQICSHPACWENLRKLSKKFADFEESMVEDTRTQHSFDESAYKIDGLSYLSIVNLLDDYGCDADDQFSPPFVDRESNGIARRTLKDVRHKDASLITRLNLQDLTQETASGITPAPANTPLQSSHGFGDGAMPSDIQNVYNSRKNVVGRVVQGEPHCSKISMSLFQCAKPRKCYVWQTSKKQFNISKTRDPSTVSQVILPVDSLPSHSKPTSWSSVRGRKSIKSMPGSQEVVRRQMDLMMSGNVKESIEAKPAKQPQTSIPYKVKHLRHVPVDVLLRILRADLSNGTITSKEASLLLQRVTGPRNVLPPIRAPTSQQAYSHSAPNRKNIVSSDFPFGLANGVKSPSFVDKPQKSFYSPPPSKPLEENEGIVSQKASSVSSKFKESKTITHTKPILRSRHSVSSMKNRTHLSNITVSNTDTSANVSSPPRPFHYMRQAQDLSLCPLPTPPPPSPSTERDSEYNLILGGSTVLAHASRIPSLSTNSHSSENPSIPDRCRDTTAQTHSTDPPSSSRKPSSTVQVNKVKVDDSESSSMSIKAPKNMVNGNSNGKDDSALPKVRPSAVEKSNASSPAPPPPSPEVPVASHIKLADNSVSVNLKDGPTTIDNQAIDKDTLPASEHGDGLG
ncbi:unnamed protein product [Clavelina lepadiformis]|uniref:RING-type E3 ubiquitin transferase n=1 Tax=Clavelina lepadiformis TaxID=159417 RepID=A0ABP0F640_CLALP